MERSGMILTKQSVVESPRIASSPESPFGRFALLAMTLINFRMRHILFLAILVGLEAPTYTPCIAQTSATGIPYFQQQVHYTLEATFHDDYSTPSIDGIGTLDYTNNSPDTLHELYFHLYWNLFTHGSYGETAPERNHDPGDKYGHGGIEIKGVSLQYLGPKDNPYPSNNLRASNSDPSPSLEVDNTIMLVRLHAPLLPGEMISVHFDWHGILPNYGIRSTWGWHDGTARDFSTAQWYPQICVYDNHGWHPDQYIGMGEFYTDYGSFDVSLTMPERFSTVVSTGWQKNPEQTLSVDALNQLQFAKSHPDSIVHVADNSNFQYQRISDNEPMRTWKFHADSVRDFAWCADEAAIWDAVYDGGVMHHALYWKNSRDFWGKEAAKIVLLTEQTNSAFAGKYMYPNMYMCETYEGGMEYPGIVFVGPYENGTTYHYPQNTMIHELGHEWYPMMMGSNETDYGYMDEGFNTFITTFVQEKYFGRWNNSVGPGLGYNDDERTSNYRASIMQQLSGNAEPSKQKADMFLSYHDYAEATYPHTSSVFFMLRYTMGDTAFADFMKLYYERWRFKHPYPDDLLNAAEDIERREGDTNRVRARGDLRWFFNEWFEQTWMLDYAIGNFSVDRVVGGDPAAQYKSTVTVERKERAVMPLDLVFTFEDGTTEQKWIPVDDWLRTVADKRTYTYTFAKHPVQVEINPSRELLDINRLNNSSSWLPKMEVSLPPKIFGDIKPIDAYAVRSAPFIVPSGDFKTWNFGWTILGSYLDRTDRLAWGPIRLQTSPDGFSAGGVLQYHSVLDCLSPCTDMDILAVDIPSRTSIQFLGGVSVSQTFNIPGSMTPRHIVNAGFDVNTQNLTPLNRGFVGYTFYNESESNNFAFNAQAESGLGDPRTTYSKLAGMIDDRFDLTDNWNAFFRLFGGSMQPIGQSLPSQTMFQISSPSDVDHISDLYGSNFGSGIRDKIRNAAMSGPLVRGYFGRDDTYGRVAASGSFEIGNHSIFPFFFLTDIPVVGHVFDLFGLTLFADAGLVTNALTRDIHDPLKSDAGIGLRYFGINTRPSHSWDVDVERTELQIDFPLYLDKPTAGERNLAFRCVAMVRQNF